MKKSVALKQISAWAGIIAPILFTVLVIVESLLRPGYSQIYNYISDLGVGPYAIILNLNLIVFGILSICVALGLGASLPATGGRVAKSIVWLMVIFGFGVIFAGVALLFPGAATTSASENYPHVLASLIAFLSIIAVQLLTWRALRASDGATWGRYRAYSLISGLLSLLLFLNFLLTQSAAYVGAMQRVFMAVPWVWIEVTGIKLNSIAKGESRRASQKS